LLLGCDLSKLDNFTLNLLTNDEVLALDQDVLGKQATQLIKTAGYQVWIKELSDGNKAIGVFNTGEDYQTIHLSLSELGMSGVANLRDLWRQKDLGRFTEFDTKIPPHGVGLFKLSK
jgi:hypothetical protein